jgi:dihydroorotate dehydrogenase electron transfer subunit
MAQGRHEMGARESLPVALEVLEVRPENAAAASVFLRRPEPDVAGQSLDLESFVPGQFFMVWMPRLDEKPYVVSHLEAERLALTVQRRGPFSTRLCELQPGDKIGMRGPFGRGFWGFEPHAESVRVALIGGGCGMAVLGPLSECLPNATVVQGARSADLLFYRERFPQQVIFTDDGTAGRRGFPTEWVREQIAAGQLDMVYVCGPELMMKSVADVCREGGVGCQVSMERYMKCGIGVCGQCDCDGLRVCADGPVFDLADLARMPSFGHRHRDGTGRSMPIAPADECPSGPAGA